MSGHRERDAHQTSMWTVWSRHAVLSVCLALIATLLQLSLHQIATKYEWLFSFNRSIGLDGLYIRTDFLSENWDLEDLSTASGIALNQLVMFQRSSLRTQERLPIADRPWEISFTWEEGCGRRPHKIWRDFFGDTSTFVSFSIAFSESDPWRHVFMLDPDRCGFSLSGRDEEEALGEYKASCLEDIRNGSHTLTLRGKNCSVTAWIDGSLCASGSLREPLETLMVDLSTPAYSCVAFDDLAIRVEEPGSGWTTLLEERFEANPFQTGRLDSRFDLDSKSARVAVTWAALAVALLADLAAMALFGRSSSNQVLLMVSLPQALAILAFQQLLFLPLLPLLCSVGTVWISKALLSLHRDPREVHSIHYRGLKLLWVAVVAAGSLAIALFVRSSLEPAWYIAAITSTASVALLLILLVGDWVKPEHRPRLVIWFALCGAQVAHWSWFRYIFTFIDLETFLLFSLVPVVFIVGRYIGAITTPSWMRISGRILTAALVFLCIEFTIRSIPIGFLLDFDWRVVGSFWDLRKHTNLIVDHSENTVFKDPHGNIFLKDKPHETFRIVCLGSSSTFGDGSENPSIDNYPSQLGLILQRCLPGDHEVINAGVGGYRLTQLRIYFEQVLSGLDPDLLIVYFGWNSDSATDLEYYRRVESALEANPSLLSAGEIEAALSLRWSHPLLIRAYLFLAKSRIFIGMKLAIDAVLTIGPEGATDMDDIEFQEESVDLLVGAALKHGAAVLLIPEISARKGEDRFLSIFESLPQIHADRPVSMLRIEGFDASSYLVDHCHMKAEGYRELARIIADYLVDSGLIQCESLLPSDR